MTSILATPSTLCPALQSLPGDRSIPLFFFPLKFAREHLSLTRHTASVSSPFLHFTSGPVAERRQWTGVAERLDLSTAVFLLLLAILLQAPWIVPDPVWFGWLALGGDAHLPPSQWGLPLFCVSYNLEKPCGRTKQQSNPMVTVANQVHSYAAAGRGEINWTKAWHTT